MKKEIKKVYQSTKQKNKNLWEKYRKEKQRIEGLKLNRSTKRKRQQKAYNKTLENLSYNWENYRGVKYAKTHKSNIQGLMLVKRRKHITVDERFYKINKNFGYSKIFKNIKSNIKGIKYILIVLKIKFTETDKIIFVSDTYTPQRLERFNNNELIDNTIKKIIYEHSYQDWQLIDVTIRLIYEGTKKTKKFKR